MSSVQQSVDIIAFISERAEMLRLLHLVEALTLPDCWIGAGFVRNAIWDALHGRADSTPADVDVVFFDPDNISPARDIDLELTLAEACPDQLWSVKNQARMHIRNGDAPYADTCDALRHWPERCTAIAVRSSGNQIEMIAPFGITDLLGLVVQPTPAFTRKMDIYRERLRQKQWQRRWPLLKIADTVPI